MDISKDIHQSEQGNDIETCIFVDRLARTDEREYRTVTVLMIQAVDWWWDWYYLQRPMRVRCSDSALRRRLLGLPGPFAGGVSFVYHL